MWKRSKYHSLDVIQSSLRLTTPSENSCFRAAPTYTTPKQNIIPCNLKVTKKLSIPVDMISLKDWSQSMVSDMKMDAYKDMSIAKLIRKNPLTWSNY